MRTTTLVLTLVAATFAAAGLGAEADHPTTTIVAAGLQFATPVATASPGALVSFANLDAAPIAPHTVTSGNWTLPLGNAPDRAFDTGPVQGVATVAFKAPERPGEYRFYCAIHPWMRGVLVVG